MLEDIQRKQGEMEIQLQQLIVSKRQDQLAMEGLDRKLLKERLKKSLKKQEKKSGIMEIEYYGCLDYVFGICAEDQRMGKTGSR